MCLAINISSAKMGRRCLDLALCVAVFTVISTIYWW